MHFPIISYDPSQLIAMLVSIRIPPAKIQDEGHLSIVY